MGFSGDKLRTHRQRAELTQQALADTVGVYRQSVNAWERGRQIPHLPMLQQLAHLLGIRVDDLFDDKYTPDA